MNVNHSQTQIKYNQTSCYFCNEWMDNEYFKHHLQQCGQILENCPNNCTAYIQRKSIRKHLLECPKSGVKSDQHVAVNTIDDDTDKVQITSVIMNNDKELIDDETTDKTGTVIRIKDKKINGLLTTTTAINNNTDLLQNQLLAMEQDINTIRSSLHEETRQRHRLITDIGNIRKHNQLADEWTNKVGDVLTALKKCLNEETDSRCSDVKNCKADIERLWFELQQIEEWRLEMRMRIDYLHNEFIEDDNIRGHIEMLLNDNRISAMKIGCLEKESETLKTTMLEHKLKTEKFMELLNEKCSIMENILAEQQVIISTLSSDHVKDINEFKTNQQLQIKQSIDELINKQSTLNFELKSMQHIVNGTEEKCDKLEKLVENTKETVYKTKQNLSDLDVHLRMQKKLAGIQNYRGHLIWRIDEYAAKFSDAKEHNTTLRSPMFCNRQYGYTLRLDVNLNGIGTWKGRNIIACLTVVAGEWDPLLIWPCKLQADIILRDQADNLKEAKDFCKTIVVKRKNEQYQQNQYIYIPHKTVETMNYIKNDVIFFEIIVHRA